MGDGVTPVAGGASWLFSGFGSQDIRAVGGSAADVAVWGDGYLWSELWLATSFGGSNPTGFPATTAWSHTPRLAGIGGATLGVGPSAFRVFAVAESFSEPHRAMTATVLGSESQVAALWSDVRQRPTLVHDTSRNRWWMLARDSAHNNYLHLYKGTASGAALTWVDFGAIPDIVTRYPVGAAYDWTSDRIVVVWANSRGDVFPGPASSWDCTQRRAPSGLANGTQPFGCRGEYLATMIEPVYGGRVATRRFLTSAGPTGYGLTGIGAPSVFCDQSLCEVFHTSRTPSRQIIAWSFPVTASGMGAAFTPVLQGGVTDFPISTASPPGGAGGHATVQVVMGSGDRKLYFRNRPNYSSGFGGWNNGSGSQSLFTGPTIQWDTALGQYQVLTTTN